MKKVLFLFAFAFCMMHTFAQQNYKQINYTYINYRTVPNGHTAPVTGVGPENGIILINTKDSSITISSTNNFGREKKDVYKINIEEPEKTEIDDNGITLKYIVLRGIDANGKTYVAQLARQTQKHKADVMQFMLKYDADNLRIYTCQYLKELNP